MEQRTTRSEGGGRSGDEPPRGPEEDPTRHRTHRDDPLADAAEGFFDPYAEPGDRDRRERAEDPYGHPPPRTTQPNLSALFVLLDALRRGLPPELREQFTALVREALLTLRSLIDWYLERLDDRPREARVEDIPID